MKQVELSDAVYAALQRLATDNGTTPDQVLASLLSVPTASPEDAEPLAAFVVSPSFRAAPTDDDRYLALLGWVAQRHVSEFGEFIRTQAHDRRYLSLSHDEIVEACRHNRARPIDGAQQYWAVMNIDAATRRRFLGRLLQFIGYRDAVIDFVCGVIGLRRNSRTAA